MTDIYDLHCHTYASDGTLSPEQLILRAKKQGVTTLAITDHDTVENIDIAHKIATEHRINFIAGIEFSCTWQGKTFHILGLDINPTHTELLAGSQRIQAIRLERAQKISAKLAKKNIPNAIETINSQPNTTMITRSHFAQFLVQHGYVDTQKNAFNHYLGDGKSAFISTEWASLEKILYWITQSGGIPVLAHPMRYKMTASWMRRFLTAFKDLGGQGIEIITARSNPDEIRRCQHFAKQFDLHGSVGSDFHSPDNPWIELGRLAPLPANIKPVWHLFSHH